MNEQQQFYFSNAINMLALALGFQNLTENRQQTAYNDVHAANDLQEKHLLAEIGKRFDEQNEILKRQNEVLFEIVARLRNGTDHTEN